MKTNTNASCLHLAVQNRNIQTVKYILSEFNGDDLKILVNEKEESFGTPLHIAGKYLTYCQVFLLLGKLDRSF